MQKKNRPCRRKVFPSGGSIVIVIVNALCPLSVYAHFSFLLAVSCLHYNRRIMKQLVLIIIVSIRFRRLLLTQRSLNLNLEHININNIDFLLSIVRIFVNVAFQVIKTALKIVMRKKPTIPTRKINMYFLNNKQLSRDKYIVASEYNIAIFASDIPCILQYSLQGAIY